MIQDYYWRTVYIHIKQCSPFLYYNKKTMICECVEILKKYNIKCSTEDATVHRPGETYVGYLKNCTYVYRYCTISRCSRDEMKLTSHMSADVQCVDNHKGILCGECEEGYSRVLGSAKCKKCTNAYVSLVILFAIIGIAVVWGLSFFNLTVSTGLINGIILYANIIKVNCDIFYPTINKDNFLSLIIAWINLDFGFEVCFFNGMNEFQKTLFQFVFPVYLWFLSLIAIYFTRRSQTLGKLLGKHCTSALATVLLLSFTKLLNIISRIFSPILIGRECADGKVNQVFAWWPDPTIHYFGKEHFVLIVIASFFIVFFITPYTLLIIASPCLQRLNSYTLFHWVARLKPFLDAYEGPYNEHWRYWTGILLVTRIGLMIIFAFNIQGYITLQLLVIAVLCILLIFITINGKGIYRMKHMNYAEVIPIMNLGIYAVTVLYLISWGNDRGLGSDKYVSILMLSIYVIQVILTILYQMVSVILNKFGIALSLKDLAVKLYKATKGQSRSEMFQWWWPWDRHNDTRYYKDPHSTLGRRLSSYKDDVDYSTTDDDDSWTKPIHDYREPLLNDPLKM